MGRPLALVTLIALLVPGSETVTAAEIRQALPAIPRRIGLSPNYLDDAAVVQFVNGQFRAGWKEAQLEPSPAATAGEWCRRAYLDIIGRIPTVDELTHFQRAPAARRKAELVERLLDSPEYTHEYAQNWATIWSNVLVGRPPAADAPRELTNREGLASYLRTCFVQNKPYDAMVYELITATGDTTPGQENFNGATNFLIDKLDDDGHEATRRSAECFLALRVQCAQCHCDPFSDWQQEQYWRMNAFFRQARAQPSLAQDRVAHAILRDVDFLGASGDARKAEIYFQSLAGKMEVAYPIFIDGTPIDPSGAVRTVNRRQELGRLMIQSDYLSPALVNRLWAHFLGHGFSEPIENLGPGTGRTYPQVLDDLAHEFAAHGYDLKRLIRWIVLSEPYGLSSRTTNKNRQDDPALGERLQFSRFYLRPLEQEQILASMLTAAALEHAADGDVARAQAATLSKEFLVAFGRDDGLPGAGRIGTIPKALMMMNGPLTAEATGLRPGTLLQKLLARRASDRDVLDHLFMAAFSRKPMAADMRAAQELLAQGRDAPSTYQDIWWALLNSNEFILNH
jgi:uncharacterized protein DUF1549/uncharacterized protein DUF1553